MKILKSILNYIPLATFIIFVVTDGIFSLTSALIFVISTIGLLINWKRKNRDEELRKFKFVELRKSKFLGEKDNETSGACPCYNVGDEFVFYRTMSGMTFGIWD